MDIADRHIAKAKANGAGINVFMEAARLLGNDLRAGGIQPALRRAARQAIGDLFAYDDLLAYSTGDRREFQNANGEIIVSCAKEEIEQYRRTKPPLAWPRRKIDIFGEWLLDL